MKPKLDKLWAAFPDHKQYPTLKDLFTWIGGNAVLNIDEPGFGANGNTCAARLSVAFNKGGYPITRNMINATGVATLGASDKSRVLFRVSDFRKLLGHQFGKPVVDKSFPFGDSFKGKKGIVAFTINFGDATGHIALWDGAGFREPDHDDYSTYIVADSATKTSLAEFWEFA